MHFVKRIYGRILAREACPGRSDLSRYERKKLKRNKAQKP